MENAECASPNPLVDVCNPQQSSPKLSANRSGPPESGSDTAKSRLDAESHTFMDLKTAFMLA